MTAELIQISQPEQLGQYNHGSQERWVRINKADMTAESVQTSEPGQLSQSNDQDMRWMRGDIFLFAQTGPASHPVSWLEVLGVFPPQSKVKEAIT